MKTKMLLLKLSIIKSHTDKREDFADVSELIKEVITTIRELEKKTSAEYIRSRQRNALKAYVALAKLEFYTEFEEIIPSVMSEKLDRLVDEILEEPTACENKTLKHAKWILEEPPDYPHYPLLDKVCFICSACNAKFLTSSSLPSRCFHCKAIMDGMCTEEDAQDE